MIVSSEILKVVAKAYAVSVADLEGRIRTKKIAEARQVVMYFMRKVGGLPFPKIGAVLQRDHTTAIYAYNKIVQDIKARPKFEKFIDKISEHLPGIVISETHDNNDLNKTISDVDTSKKRLHRLVTSEDILKTKQSLEITKREVDILLMYKKGMTLEEIASTKNLTRERIRQIVQHTLIKELGQKANSGFKIDIQEYINYQKNLHNKLRYLSDDQRIEVDRKIESGASLRDILKTSHISKEKLFEYFPQYKEKYELDLIGKKRWSRSYLKCRNCGTVTTPHHSIGYCEGCYFKSDHYKELVRASNERNYGKRRVYNQKYAREYERRPEVIAKNIKERDFKYYGGNRERAIEKSGFSCVKCGINKDNAIKKFSKDLFVYHLDRNKNNNDLNNLQVLCHGCFLKVAKGRVGANNLRLPLF